MMLMMLHRLTFLSVLCMVMVALGGCDLSGDSTDQQGKKTMSESNLEFEPAIFAKVELDSFDESACSPQDPGGKWLGIIINAPQRITYRPNNEQGVKLSVPVCIFYMASYADMENSDPMTVVVRDQRTNNVFRAVFQQGDADPVVPEPDVPPPADPSALVGMSSGGHLNYDLLNYMELPGGSATFEIGVTYAGMKSNIVKVEIVEN